MNNNGQYQIHPLLAQLLQGQGQQVSQNANDILNGTGVGSQLQGREAYLNGANAHAAGTLSNLLHNNPGGYVSNAAPLQGNQNSNVTTDNSMTLNALLGIIQQAAGMQNNAVNSATNVNGQDLQNQVQNRGLSGSEAKEGQSYDSSTNSVGYGDGSGGVTGYSPQAVTAMGPAAERLFAGKTGAKAVQLYKDIQTAGGLGKYLKSNPSALDQGSIQQLSQVNDQLEKINYLQKRIASSPALQRVMGTMGLSGLAGLNNSVINKTLGLGPDDITALKYANDLDQVTSGRDNQSVVGRIFSALINKQTLGANQLPATNMANLMQMKKLITDNYLKPMAASRGYNDFTDLPFVQTGITKMVGPNGKTQYIDDVDVKHAMQNGYKKVSN